MVDVRAVYDEVASSYGSEFANELARKPLDRALLAAFAEKIHATGRPGRVLDIGCGPGQVAGYLASLGLGAVGLEPSTKLLAVARSLFPNVPFMEGSFEALPLEDGSLAGATAFYSIVHHPSDQLGDVFREVARALRPGAPFLVSFHVGSEAVTLDEWLGAKVSVTFVFHPVLDVLRALESVGLEIDAVLERRGDPAVEHPSRRAYVLAVRAPT